MFNLLVHGLGTAWEKPSGAMDVSRFKEYSGAESDTISLERPETLRRLERIPALLMYELGADGPNSRLVRYGRLRGITVRGGDLTFQFEPDPERAYLTRGAIMEFSDLLGIHHFEQHRTHWAVKDGDLPPALLEQATSEPPQRTMKMVAEEYAEAQENKKAAKVQDLKQEIASLPRSIEKAVEMLRVRLRNKVIPEAMPHLGIRPKTEDCRAAIESVLNAQGVDARDDWHFSVAWFLDAFGSPTEERALDDSVRACREYVMRLTADGDRKRALPDVETVARTLWRCARSPHLSQQLRRRYNLLVDQLARRQEESGGWIGHGKVNSVRATALATVAIQRLGDDKHRDRLRKATSFLLDRQRGDGAWPRLDNSEDGDVVATAFTLEALRRSQIRDEISHVLMKGDEWLLQAQTGLGTWEAEDWNENIVTTLALDYLDRRGGMLSQVDGFLLMARDFFRKAEEFSFEGGANDRRLAAIATVHAVEMFMYGLFEKKPDLNVSAYRPDGNETVGPREALSFLQKALQDSGTLAPNRKLAYRDELRSLISRRDGIIHRAHEISVDELEHGMRAAKRFIEEFGAQLLNLDLLQ